MSQLTEEYLVAYSFIMQGKECEDDEALQTIERQVKEGEDLRDNQVKFIMNRIKMRTDY